MFGAMNARNLRGAFDRQKSVSENVSLSGPLLSRFDIVLVLLDDKDAAWDDAISSHIIRSHQAATGLAPAQQVRQTLLDHSHLALPASTDCDGLQYRAIISGECRMRRTSLGLSPTPLVI